MGMALVALVLSVLRYREEKSGADEQPRPACFCRIRDTVMGREFFELALLLSRLFS
jgi:hypothetical protein